MHSVILSTRCKLHPATAIALWLFFVVWLEFVPPALLSLAALALLPWLHGVTLAQFLRYLRRTRWLLLSLLAIYAYTLPGENVSGMLGSLSPSVHGLELGALRLARMILLLVALSALMAHIPRSGLLLGIYRILSPMQLFGVEAERIAVRLWLTLHYAEAALGNTQITGVKQQLDALQLTGTLSAEASAHIELPDQTMGWTDYLCLLLAIVVGAITLW